MHKYPLFSEYLVKSHFIKWAPTMFNTRNNDNNKKEFRSNFLVHTVRDSVARVELDGGEDSLTCRSSSSNWGSSISSWGSSIGSWCSGIDSRGSSISSWDNSGNSWVSSIGGWCICSKSWGSSIGGRCISSNSWGSSIGSSCICVVVSIGISRSLNLSGSIEGLKEASLGSGNLKCVRYRKRSNSVVDWGNGRHSRVDGGDWKVVTSHTESKFISNIVDGVDSSLISIGVRSSDSSVGISLFLLGRVDVLVSISKVAELILSLELGADWASNRGSSSSIGNWGSSIGSRGSGITGISSWGNSNWGGSISSWDSSKSWGVGSSVLSSDNWGSSSKSRGSSNGASGQGTSIQSCDGSSISELSINSCGNWAGSITSCIRGSISICPIVKTSTAKVLGGDGELSLSGSSSKNGGNNSKELHGVTSLLCVAKRSPC